jgi:phosphopantetheinyl transferase (holo-ACP synthase)
MGEYFDMMRGFLAQQQHVVAGWQAAPVAEAGVETVPFAEEAQVVAPAFPLLHQVLSQDATQLRALCQLSVAQQAFLRDHVLSGRGSETDPELWGLACVPLMVSLEIMAHAAAVLAPGQRLTVVEQVRAFDWIALDQGELSLEVQAQQVGEGAAPRVRVSLWQQGARAVEADLLFDAPVHLPALPALGPAQAARWDGAEIYDIGMFHGPIFQSLDHIQGWNGGGLDCELSPCSLAGFLEEGQTPWLVLNPVLLDAMGQLAACWVAEHVGTDFNCFPSSIERLELWQPLPAWAPGVVLRGRQHAVDASAAADVASPRSWAFEAVDAQGQPLVRVQGWVNVFFHVPNRFYQVRRSPLQGWLGGPLDSDLPALLWQVDPLPEAFCAQSSGIFLRMLAHAVLSFEERQDWRALKGSLKHRRQWLMGRMALKEVVRYWAYQQSGELLYPSDVVVQHDALGAPSVGGWWVDNVVPVPAVSLTHDAQTCTAALSLDGQPVGVDREDLQRLRRPEALERAFTEQERAWWSAQPEAQRAAAALRLWCCKEAASKLLGRGLQGRPEAFEVHWDPASEGTALVHCGDSMVRVQLRQLGQSLLALAAGEPLAVQVQP